MIQTTQPRRKESFTPVDRNIITQADVVTLDLSSTSRGSADGTVTVPTADDYLSKLLKQVPLEIIGAYLVLEGFINTGLMNQPVALQWVLAVLFFLGVVASYFFTRRVLHVRRQSQLLTTCASFCIWVYAVGGWFSLVAGYQPWLASCLVVAFAVFVRIAQIPPLPQEDGN